MVNIGGKRGLPPLLPLISGFVFVFGWGCFELLFCVVRVIEGGGGGLIVCFLSLPEHLQAEPTPLLPSLSLPLSRSLPRSLLSSLPPWELGPVWGLAGVGFSPLLMPALPAGP